MRYRLRTLLLVATLGPPMLAYAWLGRHSLGLAIGWIMFTSLFAIWYWMLWNAQS